MNTQTTFFTIINEIKAETGSGVASFETYFFLLSGDLSREDELSVEYETEKATEEPKPTDTKVSRYSRGPIKNKDTSDELSLPLDEVNDDLENVRLNDSKSHATPKHGNQRDTSVEPVARKRIQFDQGNDSYDSIFVPVPTRGSDDGSVASGKEAVMPSHTMQTGVDTLSVFIAKYTYDPLEHSPNDDPSLELALEAGDYVYVFGDADEVKISLIKLVRF